MRKERKALRNEVANRGRNRKQQRNKIGNRKS